MGLLKVELGSYSETCHGGSQFVSIKVEEVTDIQSEEEEKEEDPLLITYPELEAEVEVSCKLVCTFLGRLLKYP
jgi:hypothetical protein